MEQKVNSNRVRCVFCELVPLGCLALGGLCVSLYVLMYPHHFAESCQYSVETRQFRAANYNDLLFVNLAWIVPAIPLLFLGRKTYVQIVYFLIGILFLLSFLSIIPEDLTGYVNCYKRLGEGMMIIGLLQLLQVVILLLFSLVIGVVTLIRRFFGQPSETPRGSGGDVPSEGLSSFRDGPKDQTRNLEIPGSHLRCAPE